MNSLAYFNTNDGTGLLGLGESARFVLPNDARSLESLQEFVDAHQGEYIFMGLSYDLKQITLNAPSSKENTTDIPLAFLWVPEVVVRIQDNELETVLYGELTAEYNAAVDTFFEGKRRSFEWNAHMQARTSKAHYHQTFDQLIESLQYGNIYEVNYCQEFFDDSMQLDDPEAAYFRLNEITQAPFSAYIAFDTHRILCGSPERFLERKGDTLWSQPIKGTSKRGAHEEEDELLKQQLLENPKERSENVMIVDLVRNDLSKIAQPASVQVDELFGVYTFKTVHQLISTISCKVKPEVSFAEILHATFPMGSMTGAPKKSAVEIIETQEDFRRGLYSGSLGYIAPNGDFDLNVVIRSLIYNTETNYLSCAVGGAITIQASAEAEYEECKVKVKTILDRMHGEP